MKNNNKSKKVILGIILTVFLLTSINVFAAASIKKTIDVYYNNIKLVVDGKPVTFGKDSSGATVEPFTFNGTTYLPVRAVGEALDKNVSWDGKTQTVYLGENPGAVSYLTEVLEPFNSSNIQTYNLNDPTKIDIAGKEFSTGYGKGNYKESTLRFNLNGQYKELNFSYGPHKYYLKNPGVMNIYLDDSLYKSLSITQNDDVKDITINVTGVQQLRFEMEYSSTSTYIGIGNPTIK